jgi:4a-hydroxytetrahydrobiopterin dehydratase
MKALTESEIKTFCDEHTPWKLSDGKLLRDWTFQDFRAAMAFVNQVADVAEDVGHHPDIDIRYNKVRLGLVTHDSGGITRRDLDMATRLSNAFDL